MGGTKRDVLVLGAGMLGTSVARALLDCGDAVTVLTRSAPSAMRSRALQGATVHIGDVRHSGTLPHVLAGMDHVVYALGSFSPAEAAIRPAQELVEVLPALVELLEMLRLHDGIGLSFLSSGGAVYGPMTDGPHHEQSPTRPISSYGIAKLACEQFVTMYHQHYGLPTSIYRISNVYGPAQIDNPLQGLIGELLRAVGDGHTVGLFGGVGSVRDYVHVDDVAQMIARLSHSPAGQRLLNVGTGIGTTTGEVVDLVAEVTGVRPEVAVLPPRPFDVAGSVLDVSSLRRTAPWTPRSLADGVAQTWDEWEPRGPR